MQCGVPYPVAKSGSSCERIIAHNSCVAPDNRNRGGGEMDRYNLDSENNLWMVYDAEKTKFRIRVQLESGHDGTECHQRGPFREKKTPSSPAASHVV